MKIQNIQDCFFTKLSALHDIETQITKALPKAIKGAHNKTLKDALTNHLKETKEHVTRLEQIFKALERKPVKIKVEAIRGLADDAAWVLDQSGSPEALDSLLISSLQYVEHYEIAGYKAAISWAETLGLDSASELLQMTLTEEENADTTLNDIAEDINVEASDGSVVIDAIEIAEDPV